MKLMYVGGIVIAALMGGACAASPSTAGGGGSAGTGGDSPTGGNATSSGATSSGATGTGGGEAKVSYCQIPCASPKDCATAGQPLYDENHYACENTKCRYLGCVSTAECAADSPVLICAPDALHGVPTCQVACATNNDCGTDSPGGSSHAHFSCDGACHYIGCLSNDECPPTPEHPSWVCDLSGGIGYPLCAIVCNTVADCAAPDSPYAKNYACSEHRCRYLGCLSNAECATQLNDPAYVCAE
jgi:hypothetical protein